MRRRRGQREAGALDPDRRTAAAADAAGAPPRVQSGAGGPDRSAPAGPPGQAPHPGPVATATARRPSEAPVPEPHRPERIDPPPAAAAADHPEPPLADAVAGYLWPSDRAPACLLAAVPSYTGMQHTDDLLLVGLADGRLDSTASVGLDRVADRAVLEDLVDQLCRPGLDAALVAVLDSGQREQPQGSRGLAEDVRSALAGRRVDVAWSVWAESLQPQAAWAHHDTSHRGLLPDPGRDATGVLRAVLRGTLSLPGREAVRAHVLGSDRLSTASPGGDHQVGRPAAGRELSVDSAFADAANRRLSEVATATAGPAHPREFGDLHSLAQRLPQGSELDRALALTARAPAIAIELWRAVLAAADVTHRAAPATLLAAAYYLLGDARIARIALQVAGETDPGLPLLRALRELADQGLPPRSVRALLTSPPG